MGGVTCKTYNGHNVVDYILCSQTSISRLLEFNIGACPIELKSDHMPLLVKLDIQNHRSQETDNSILHKNNNSRGKISLNQENQELFVTALEYHLQI